MTKHYVMIGLLLAVSGCVEASRDLLTAQPAFCDSTPCPSGTRCDEQQRACVPLPPPPPPPEPPPPPPPPLPVRDAGPPDFGPEPECRFHQDCPEGELCVNQMCEPRPFECRTKEDCDFQEICNEDFECEVYEVGIRCENCDVNLPCYSSSDCPNNAECFGFRIAQSNGRNQLIVGRCGCPFGRCVIGQNEDNCLTQDDCPAGQQCHREFCVLGTLCNGRTPCQGGPFLPAYNDGVNEFAPIGECLTEHRHCTTTTCQAELTDCGSEEGCPKGFTCGELRDRMPCRDFRDCSNEFAGPCGDDGFCDPLVADPGATCTIDRPLSCDQLF